VYKRQLSPRELIDAARARGVQVVAVVGDGDIASGLDAARMAPPGVRVIVAQQIHTAQGDVVGMFLSRPVPDGTDIAPAVDRVHEQGGVVMLPHPVWGVGPGADTIRALGDRIHCVEALAGPASVMRSTVAIEDARLMQAFGLRTCAGSGATSPEQIGSAHVRMPAFEDAEGFLRALDDAEPIQQRRGLRPASLRERRRTSEAEA